MGLVLRILLKMLAVPLWFLLVLVVALCSFALSFAGFILWILSVLVAIGGVVLLFTDQVAGGVAFLVIAFLISPYGLPALMAWSVGRLDTLRCSLRAFIFEQAN